MMVEIVAVNSPSLRRRFLAFPWKLYRKDRLWVPPLLPERKKIIDPEKGAFFQRGEAEFFAAFRGDDLVGTICAAQDLVANELHDRSDCIFGFFESFDDINVAGALFDHVIAWGKERKLKRLFGPFNLDYEDSYGVLIEGRDRPPVILCGHTPAYYQRLFERYGFQKARGDNLAFAINVLEDTPERRRLRRLADRMRARGWVSVRGADLSRWDEEVDRVYGLINRALQHLPDHIAWQREALQATLESFRQFADPELVLFAEVEGQAVGWFPGIPNLNEITMHLNGLRYPWDYLRLALHRGDKPECVAIKSVLILPEYWQTGVALLLFDEMAQRAAEKGYRWADLSLTSEDNPYTPGLANRMGARIYKRYRTYSLPIGEVTTFG
jgi:GNAT superfamily N-acetyltransferase